MRVHTHLWPAYQDMVAEKDLAGAAMTEFDDSMNGLDVCNPTFDANRSPFLTNSRANPFEQASERGASDRRDLGHFHRAFVIVPAQVYMRNLLKTLDKYPPRSRPARFSSGDALTSIQEASRGTSCTKPKDAQSWSVALCVRAPLSRLFFVAASIRLHSTRPPRSTRPHRTRPTSKDGRRRVVSTFSSWTESADCNSSHKRERSPREAEQVASK